MLLLVSVECGVGCIHCESLVFALGLPRVGEAYLACEYTTITFTALVLFES